MNPICQALSLNIFEVYRFFSHSSPNFLRGITLALLLSSTTANAQTVKSDSRTRAVPVIFSTENLGVSLGLGGVSIGLGQPQAAIFALGFYSENKSSGLSIGAVNYQIPRIPSLYLSGLLYQGELPQYRYFSSADPGYSIRSNSASPEFQKLGLDQSIARLQARWILPIGNAKHPDFKLANRAFLPGQSQPKVSWNPQASGITSFRLQWEQQSQTYREIGQDTRTGADTFRAQIDWDNTGSRLIPEAGIRASLGTSWGNNHYQKGTWRLNEAQISGFIPLPFGNDNVQQQVIALNLYAADAPDWDATNTNNRPPEYLGARLGGLIRFRGYANARYVDRSAWAYSAEYRVIPKWQPLAHFFNTIGYRVPWWQFVLFSDFGRVAPEFDLAEFHRDMKITAGIGFRILAEGLLIRIDFGSSEDESTTVVMIDQSF